MIPRTENDYNNFKDTIYDKYNNSGYLIQRDDFYIFQPNLFFLELGHEH